MKPTGFPSEEKASSNLDASGGEGISGAPNSKATERDQKEDPMNDFMVIHWDDGDGIFVAEVPELPGCQAHGTTKAEAVQKAEEVIAL